MGRTPYLPDEPSARAAHAAAAAGALLGSESQPRPGNEGSRGATWTSILEDGTTAKSRSKAVGTASFLSCSKAAASSGVRAGTPAMYQVAATGIGCRTSRRLTSKFAASHRPGLNFARRRRHARTV